ncbi:MAG: hypothetical protein WCO96_07090 [Actinomycetes bacterium]
MAEDLTPRDPSRDHGDLIEPANPVEAASPLATQGPPGPAGAHPKAARFRAVKLIAVALGLVVLIAGATALFEPAKTSAVSSSSEWAAWNPTSDGQAGLDQIASHVGRRYRNVDGQQLVAITGEALAVSGTPAKIAIRNADGKGNIKLVEGESVLFRLCGLGPRCSIVNGKPSLERRMLLQREALELALYTLRANPEVENVLVLAPPRPGKEKVKGADGRVTEQFPPAPALLLQRDRLQEMVDKPLVETLPDPVPTVATIRNAPDTPQVAQLTLKPLFTASFIETQDGAAYVVLDPLAG